MNKNARWGFPKKKSHITFAPKNTTQIARVGGSPVEGMTVARSQGDPDHLAQAAADYTRAAHAYTYAAYAHLQSANAHMSMHEAQAGRRQHSQHGARIQNPRQQVARVQSHQQAPIHAQKLQKASNQNIGHSRQPVRGGKTGVPDRIAVVGRQARNQGVHPQVPKTNDWDTVVQAHNNAAVAHGRAAAVHAQAALEFQRGQTREKW
ncbi:hypothetical protein NLI96_g4321 [Meripilus lineatus]|uniref:Uncharacterized protein n=1 Tax=Meripilus lineatus TaxID=2056292 RepID=A0AAD5YFT3_9APHY|nr:hypothetical protein NLI96_g4321 [Physisporinus lineatus]